MFRRLSILTIAWVVLFALLSTGTAVAQDADADDEAPVEEVFYGDVELIDTLRTYGLLDEWIEASPVSPQASVLLVTGNENYQARRQAFLNSVESWADGTVLVRMEIARIDTARAHADRLRSIITQVRVALILDDRLATDSKTLLEIEDALGQLTGVEPSKPPPGELEDSLTLAEVQLNDLWQRAETELMGLNGLAPAIASSGIESFGGFEALRIALNDVDQLLTRASDLLGPAREQSERRLSVALAQLPGLHGARMLGSTDVGGLSVVTIDAYIRGAARSSCSVDWALLAGVGEIESNHGRIGGASVSRSGQVSTPILGPVLDGGASDRETDAPQVNDARWTALFAAVKAAQLAAGTAIATSPWGLHARVNDSNDEPGDEGNGFAVVIDTDGGQLDGNEQWDRAIGPMQFLPETWSKWATDGNGDGVSDPHNLYDAAAAAARFLCDLSETRGPSPSTFVLGYNASTSYVRSVLATARDLRATSLPAI